MVQDNIPEALGYGFLPVTLIHSTHKPLSATQIHSSIESFRSQDDVFSNSFGSALVIQEEIYKMPDDDKCYYHHELVSQYEHIFVSHVSREGVLPPGPYFLDHGRIHQAWRLYEDRLGAFNIPVIPENPVWPLRSAPFGLLSFAIDFLDSNALVSRARLAYGRKWPYRVECTVEGTRKVVR